jgi:glutamate-1-semialdehyde 2,1-aminomutase
MPVGAYGARKEIMGRLSPLGPVYQAGTLAGNPLAMAVGLATLDALHEPGVYEELERKSAHLAEGLAATAHKAGVPVFQTRVGSMLCGFFQNGPVTDYASACRSDTERYKRFFHAMLDRGVYLAPSQYEVMFISIAHTDDQIDQTIGAAREAFAALSR